jgi:hypothetical protein
MVQHNGKLIPIEEYCEKYCIRKTERSECWTDCPVWDFDNDEDYDQEIEENQSMEIESEKSTIEQLEQQNKQLLNALKTELHIANAHPKSYGEIGRLTLAIENITGKKPEEF